MGKLILKVSKYLVNVFFIVVFLYGTTFVTVPFAKCL